jgi:modification methylase
MSDHTPAHDDSIGDATRDTLAIVSDIPVDMSIDMAPPAATPSVPPAWVCTAASPLTATLALDEYATDTGRPVSLWPTAQRSDAAQRADRYAPDMPKHPARVLPDTAARIIRQYSKPGQRVLGLFCGSGTTVVEAVYGWRDAVGVDSDPRWAAVAQANIAYALDLGAFATGEILCADVRRRPDPPRRMRRSVDLLIATPPARLNHRRATPYDSHELIRDLENDLADVLRGCMPLLRPGGAVAFVTRLTPFHGELVDPAYSVHRAAFACGLEPVERAAAVHFPIRDASQPTQATRSGRPSRRRPGKSRRATPRVVHDDVLIYQVPTRGQLWRYRMMTGERW